jgi:uncharacterized ferredoxin-like protein
MELAARTAPKALGKDLIETVLLSEERERSWARRWWPWSNEWHSRL